MLILNIRLDAHIKASNKFYNIFKNCYNYKNLNTDIMVNNR